MQNFHRALRMSDVDVQAFVPRKAAKHDRLFPLIEAAILETPLLSPHQQYVNFCEAHPTDVLSEKTFQKYATELDDLKIVTRVQQFVKPETERGDLRGYFTELLASDRVSGAQKKEIVEIVPDVVSPSSSLPGLRFEGLSRSSIQKKLLVVFLDACPLPRDILAPLLGGGKKRIFTIGFMTSVVRNWSGRLCARLWAGADR